MRSGSHILIIGGSAGSLQMLLSILKALPAKVNLPVVVVLHRQKNVVSEMRQILETVNERTVIEPDDKEPVQENVIYLAPQNYHLLVEEDKTFSLDYSEVVKYSRPSIDVTFESAAMVYGKGAIAILLSGANSDGTAGMQAIIEKGGKAIVQDPETAEYPAMPSAAIQLNDAAHVMSPGDIIQFVENLANAQR